MLIGLIIVVCGMVFIYLLLRLITPAPNRKDVVDSEAAIWCATKRKEDAFYLIDEELKTKLLLFTNNYGKTSSINLKYKFIQMIDKESEKINAKNAK